MYFKCIRICPRLSVLLVSMLFSILMVGPSASLARAEPSKQALTKVSKRTSKEIANAPSNEVSADTPIAPHKDWSFDAIELMPVQNGGRIKPMDSLAREVVLYETGSRSFKGWNAVDLLFSWIAFPKYWEDQPIVRVGREDVRRQLGLEEKRVFYTPRELFKNPILLQYAQRIGKGVVGSDPPGTPRANPRDQELKTVLDRLGLFHSFVTGQGWILIPKAAPAAWLSLVEQDHDGDFIRTQFVDVLKFYQAGDRAQFQRSSLLLRAAVEGEIPHYGDTLKNQIFAEAFFNRLRPFGISSLFYLFSALGWTFFAFSQSRQAGPLVSVGKSQVSISKKARFLKKSSVLFLTLALFSHIVGFGLRCYVAGRPPVTNMYESVIWVSLGIVVFAIILDRLHRQPGVLAVASALAVLGLIAGDSAPAMMDPSIRPLVPVLRSNYWLTVHVLTITLGYAAFALSLGLTNVTLFHFLKRPAATTQAKIAEFNQLTYRALQFGVVLIAAGTILGGIWADYSWGRFWGWDPKEVWALITLLCYLVILHGRFTNWVGQLGFAALTAVSFLSVVMAWYGVNFVLGVGLHSYGFSSGGMGWVGGFVGLQLAYVLLAATTHLRRRLRKGAVSI